MKSLKTITNRTVQKAIIARGNQGYYIGTSARFNSEVIKLVLEVAEIKNEENILLPLNSEGTSIATSNGKKYEVDGNVVFRVNEKSVYGAFTGNLYEINTKNEAVLISSGKIFTKFKATIKPKKIKLAS